MKSLLLPACYFQAITLRSLWVVFCMLWLRSYHSLPQGCKLLSAIYNSSWLCVPAKMSVPVKAAVHTVAGHY